MATLKATVSGNIKGNRLLKKSTGESGVILSVCGVGEQPEFRSTGPLVDGQPVTIVIKDAPVWVIEAGGVIASGETVGVGAEGVVVKSDSGFGYAASDVEAGELVQVVRQGGSGGAGEKGPTGAKGADGATGAKGPVGEQGPIGEQGPVGEKGPTGDKGPDGEQGPVGNKGPDGDQGPIGEQGPPGEPAE